MMGVMYYKAVNSKELGEISKLRKRTGTEGKGEAERGRGRKREGRERWREEGAGKLQV